MKKNILFNVALSLLIIFLLIIIFFNFTPLINMGGDDALKYSFGKRFSFDYNNYKSWHHYYRWASWMFAKFGTFITNNDILSYYLSSYISSISILIFCIFICYFFSPILSLFFFLIIITDKYLIHSIFQLTVQTTALIPFSILIIYLTKIKFGHVNNFKILVISILIFLLYANKVSIAFLSLGLASYLLINKEIIFIKKIIITLLILYFFESIFFYIYYENTTVFGKFINLIKNGSHFEILKKYPKHQKDIYEYLQILLDTWTKPQRFLALLSIVYSFLFLNKDKRNKNNFVLLSYLFLSDIILKSTVLMWYDDKIILIDPLFPRNLILTDILSVYILIIFTYNVITENRIFLLNYFVFIIIIYKNILPLTTYLYNHTNKFVSINNIYKNIIKNVNEADCIFYEKWHYKYLFSHIFDFKLNKLKKSNYYKILRNSKNSDLNCNKTYYLEKNIKIR